jgi:hypothetical protein
MAAQQPSGMGHQAFSAWGIRFAVTALLMSPAIALSDRALVAGSGSGANCSRDAPCAPTLTGRDGSPATALSDRTWVSSSGSGATCSRAAPCATFQTAHDVTYPEGEINCVDSGEFGPLTIWKAITIRCVGVIAGISGGVLGAVNVNAGATDTVVLDGVDLNGFNAYPQGVVFNSGSKLYIINSSIRRFTANGVVNQSRTPGAHLFIDDTRIIGNAHGVAAGGQTITSLTHVSILGSSVRSVGANGSATIIGIEKSVLNDAPTGIGNAGGQVISVGSSNLVTGAGSFTATIPYR